MYLSQAIETLEHENYSILADKLKSLRPQPKVEWSEEDKNTYKWVYNLFERSNDKWFECVFAGCYPKVKRESVLAWLKSLRPSWKPSEDEERLINTSISFLKDFADKGYENAVECIDWLKSKLNGNPGK